ncbi:MAG: phage holin family protein [Chitinophagaceae bacterium]
MKFLFKILVMALAAIVSSYLLPGVHIANFTTALVFAAVLALLNVLLKPILIILTLPITVLTLGFFLLVINALMILVASHFVRGIYVEGFWWALFFSILMSIISSILVGLGRREI